MIKDKNLYSECKLYYGECEQCRDNYIGERIQRQSSVGRNMIILTKSEPAERIKRNNENIFKCKILCPALPQNTLGRNFYCVI